MNRRYPLVTGVAVLTFFGVCCVGRHEQRAFVR